MSTIKVDTYQTRGGASEISIDKLKGVTTTDVINVQTGSVTTVLQLGIASHVLYYNHKTPANLNSFNTSGVVDDAVGEYTVTVTSAYVDLTHIFTNSNNFNTNGEADPAGGQLHQDNSNGNEVAPTTTAYKVRTDGTGDNSKDLKYNYTTILGDLA